jgi:hypothetical protein
MVTDPTLVTPIFFFARCDSGKPVLLVHGYGVTASHEDNFQLPQGFPAARRVGQNFFRSLIACVTRLLVRNVAVAIQTVPNSPVYTIITVYVITITITKCPINKNRTYHTQTISSLRALTIRTCHIAGNSCQSFTMCLTLNSMYWMRYLASP